MNEIQRMHFELKRVHHLVDTLRDQTKFQIEKTVNLMTQIEDLKKRLEAVEAK